MSSLNQFVDSFLAGQRGRRLLVSWLLNGQEARPQELSEALWEKSFQTEQDRGDAVARFGFVLDDRGEPVEQSVPSVQLETKTVSLEHIATLISAVPLSTVREDALIAALVESVDWARYWQPADGTDTLFTEPVLINALRPVAEHVAGSEIIQQWAERNTATDQWSITWRGEGSEGQWVPGQKSVSETLDEWFANFSATERARQDNLKLPLENVASGEWWSNPERYLYATTSTFTDSVPIGLACVEDSFGFEEATATRIQTRVTKEIYEITDAEAWTELCRRYPMDLSATMRRVWFETTGRDGSWVIPNWKDVARDYDGVYLPIISYLALAGEVIPVDEHSASLIAGWTPGVTFWFTDNVERMSDTAEWALTDAGSTYRWVRQ